MKGHVEGWEAACVKFVLEKKKKKWGATFRLKKNIMT